MELINTGENAMTNTNKIVGLKLTGINKKRGGREEIAGTWGVSYMTEEKIAEVRAWLIKESQNPEWTSHFEHLQIEVTKTFAEIEAVA